MTKQSEHKAKKEKEKQEREKRRAESSHKFEDEEYFKQRAKSSENLGNALQQGTLDRLLNLVISEIKCFVLSNMEMEFI